MRQPPEKMRKNTLLQKKLETASAIPGRSALPSGGPLPHRACASRHFPGVRHGFPQCSEASGLSERERPGRLRPEHTVLPELRPRRARNSAGRGRFPRTEHRPCRIISCSRRKRPRGPVPYNSCCVHGRTSALPRRAWDPCRRIPPSARFR